MSGYSGRALTRIYQDEPVTVARIRTGQEARPDWWLHPTDTTGASDWIYYDRAAADTYQDIFRCRIDGTGEVDLSALITGLPSSNQDVGCVVAHPGGDWIVVLAQRNGYTDPTADPGFGVGFDLYAVNTSTWAATQLTTSGTGTDHGALHPKFSADGTKICWQRHYADTLVVDETLSWYTPARLCTANWTVTAGVPSLGSIVEREASPLNLICEPGSWVGNTKVLYWSTGFADGGPSTGHLIELTLATGAIRYIVTNSSLWVEFPTINAAEDRLAFLSSSGDDWDHVTTVFQALDLWLADDNGENRRQLTRLSEIGHPHYTVMSGNEAYKYSVSDPSWGRADSAGNPRLVVSVRRFTRATGASLRLGLLVVTIQDL